jgi:hypothetical protein
MTSQRRAVGLPGEWNAGIRRHKVDHGSPSWSPTPGPGTDYRGHMPAKLALLQQSRPNLQANRRTVHCDVRPDPCRTGVRQIPGEDREPGGRAAHYALLLSAEVIPRVVVTMPSRRRHSPGEYTDDSTTRWKPTPVSRPQVPAAEQASEPQPSAVATTAQIAPSGALRAKASANPTADHIDGGYSRVASTRVHYARW